MKIKDTPEEWREAFEQFESISGFEIMFLDEVESGEITYRECWHQNLGWLESMFSDCVNISIPEDTDHE